MTVWGVIFTRGESFSGGGGGGGGGGGVIRDFDTGLLAIVIKILL